MPSKTFINQIGIKHIDFDKRNKSKVFVFSHKENLPVVYNIRVLKRLFKCLMGSEPFTNMSDRVIKLDGITVPHLNKNFSPTPYDEVKLRTGLHSLVAIRNKISADQYLAQFLSNQLKFPYRLVSNSETLIPIYFEKFIVTAWKLNDLKMDRNLLDPSDVFELLIKESRLARDNDFLSTNFPNGSEDFKLISDQTWMGYSPLLYGGEV